MKTVAVLCAARNSIYREFTQCEIYDTDRDAVTFTGGMPVIAHPPCRYWSAFCRHQAKRDYATAAEMCLGVWCVRQVQQWGGVVEQPAYSLLFKAAGVLPTIEVKQCDWGHNEQKKTWLYIVDCQIPPLPRVRAADGSRRAQQVKSKHQRSATPRLFAEWLITLTTGG